MPSFPREPRRPPPFLRHGDAATARPAAAPAATSSPAYMGAILVLLVAFFTFMRPDVRQRVQHAQHLLDASTLAILPSA